MVKLILPISNYFGLAFKKLLEENKTYYLSKLSNSPQVELRKILKIIFFEKLLIDINF